MPLEILPVPAFSDNYIYLLHEPESGATAVMDPGDAGPVKAALTERGWKLTHILITHDHWDHSGGVGDLSGAEVLGFKQGLKDGDELSVGNSRAKVFHVPGHTTDHLAFWFAEDKALFCGDALFSMGCGRMFTGPAKTYWASLEKLRALPDETRVFCAHEYTRANITFAKDLEPDNPAVAAFEIEAEARLAATGSSLPSLLGEEKKANPFLRADDPALQAKLGMSGADPVEVFAEIRRRKDRF